MHSKVAVQDTSSNLQHRYPSRPFNFQTGKTRNSVAGTPPYRKEGYKHSKGRPGTGFSAELQWSFFFFLTGFLNRFRVGNLVPKLK